MPLFTLGDPPHDDPPKTQGFERGDVRGEDLYRMLGRTVSGRYLAVFFIYKEGGRALVI
jgi:hypothetical protein